MSEHTDKKSVRKSLRQIDVVPILKPPTCKNNNDLSEQSTNLTIQKMRQKITSHLEEIEEAISRKDYMKAHNLNIEVEKLDKIVRNSQQIKTTTSKLKKPKIEKPSSPKPPKQLKQVKMKTQNEIQVYREGKCKTYSKQKKAVSSTVTSTVISLGNKAGVYAPSIPPTSLNCTPTKKSSLPSPTSFGIHKSQQGASPSRAEQSTRELGGPERIGINVGSNREPTSKFDMGGSSPSSPLDMVNTGEQENWQDSLEDTSLNIFNAASPSDLILDDPLSRNLENNNNGLLQPQIKKKSWLSSSKDQMLECGGATPQNDGTEITAAIFSPNHSLNFPDSNKGLQFQGPMSNNKTVSSPGSITSNPYKNEPHQNSSFSSTNEENVLANLSAIPNFKSQIISDNSQDVNIDLETRIGKDESDSDGDFDLDMLSSCKTVQNNWVKIGSSKNKKMEERIKLSDSQPLEIDERKLPGTFKITAKRKLTIDESTQLSVKKEMRLEDILETSNSLDLAPPTKRLMSLAQNGVSNKLLNCPGRQNISKSLSKQFLKDGSLGPGPTSGSEFDFPQENNLRASKDPGVTDKLGSRKQAITSLDESSNTPPKSQNGESKEKFFRPWETTQEISTSFQDRDQLNNGVVHGGSKPECVRGEDRTGSQKFLVTNLPTNCTEQDLKNLFSSFGKVKNLRINSKAPTIGCLVFENKEGLEKAMKAKPILLFGSHRLNIMKVKKQSPGHNPYGVSLVEGLEETQPQTHQNRTINSNMIKTYNLKKPKIKKVPRGHSSSLLISAASYDTFNQSAGRAPRSESGGNCNPSIAQIEEMVVPSTIESEVWQGVTVESQVQEEESHLEEDESQTQAKEKSSSKVKKQKSNFECTECSCRFKTVQKLQMHTEMTHVPIPCPHPQCNKKILRRRMDRHLDTHSEEKKIACPFPDCIVVVKRRDNLNAHIRNVHHAN